MRDYWNDPPEEPEPPSCPADKCEGSGEYLYDGKEGMVFSCDTCAYQWVIPFPVDPQPEPELTAKELAELEAIEDEARGVCPHGKSDGCDTCDFLGDLAYDTDRERRHFGR